MSIYLISLKLQRDCKSNRCKNWTINEIKYALQYGCNDNIYDTHGDTCMDCLYNLQKYYEKGKEKDLKQKNKMLKKTIKELEKKNKELEEQIQYMPGGFEYEKTKEHFMNLLQHNQSVSEQEKEIKKDK